MRAASIVLLTAVLLAIALVALAPAALVAPRLAEASRGVVTLVEPEGRLWQGRATLATASHRLPFAWSVDAADLLRGRFTLRVSPQDAGGTMPAATVTARRDGMLLSGVDVLLPASAVSAPFTSASGIAVGGDLSVSIGRLELRDGSVSGQATAVWRRARVVAAAGGPVRDLGEVTATLAGNDRRFAGPLSNAGGQLAIRGDIAVNLRGVASVTALVTPRSADDDELASLLAAVGRREAGGWRIDWRNGVL